MLRVWFTAPTLHRYLIYFAAFFLLVLGIVNTFSLLCHFMRFMWPKMVDEWVCTRAGWIAVEDDDGNPTGRYYNGTFVGAEARKQIFRENSWYVIIFIAFVRFPCAFARELC